MSLANPYVLWDVGFQLSFAATAGLIFYTEPLTQLFERGLTRLTNPKRAEWLVGWLSDAVIVTLAAQITTTPIIVGTFGRLSLVTLFTNFLILPAQPFVMLWGGLALMAGLVLYPLGQALSWIAWGFLKYTIETVYWTADFPGASVDVGQLGLPLIWGYYLLLIALTWWFSQPVKARWRWLVRARNLATWQVTAGAMIVALLFIYLYTLPDGRLHVFFLDAGHGDAILLKTPGGEYVMIDGGPEAPRTLSQLGQHIPFWKRRLALVALTSPDAERLAGLIPVLERYPVDFVMLGPEVGQDDLYQRWAELVQSRAPETVGTLSAGEHWALDGSVRLRVLWPEADAQPGPMVLQVVYEDTRVLLPGDATTTVEQALVRQEEAELPSDVLHLARHGAATSSTKAFLEAAAPEAVVLTLGEKATPAPVVLARLKGIQLYRTDQHGTVEVISDGQRVEVRTEK